MSFLKRILLIICYPAECMQIVKREKNYPFWQTVLLYTLAFLSNYLYGYTVHFPLATKGRESISILLEFAILVIPLLSWVLCSYAMTALMDGESNFANQLIVSGYCTVPNTVFTLISIIASQVMSSEEIGLFCAIRYAGLLWMVILLFVSLIILNDYTFLKAFAITLLSLLAIVVLWAVLLLLYALTVQLFSVVFNLISEIRFKMI